MNNIREYLCDAAAKITDAAGKHFASKKALLAGRDGLRSKYLEMMGIVDLPPPPERRPLNAIVTAKTERPAFTVERLRYESLPRLYVTANLYVPKKLDGPAPAVLYVCGHSPRQKLQFQHHCRRWAELGFVTLVVDTIQYGEIKGYHHVCYAKGWFHCYSRGYTPAGVELLNGIRGVDLLCSRPEVDADRVGVTGISGGGAMSWWVGAADERLKVVAPVCGTGTLRSHIAERTLDGHCDCMYFINYYGMDLADLGALIAPRPLFIGSADRDFIYSIASIRECYERAKIAYDLLGVPENIRLVETPGPHSYHANSRQGIFAWFLKHLCGRDVPPSEIADVDESNPIPDEDLIVYVNGPPADERTATIQDSFVPLAPKPNIRSVKDLRAERKRVVAGLQAHFPAEPCELDCRTEYEFAHGDGTGRRLSFTPEVGWRLSARLTTHKSVQGVKAPVYVEIAGRGKRSPWATSMPGMHRFEVEPRGTGETEWGDGLARHVRRAAAVTGRTIASMRVYDVLRAVELARALPECDGSIVLAGDGEMAAVAVYAALLDGGIRAVVLANAPPTLDAPSDPDGSGPAIEMLGALRFADLPVAAGLLYPTELVFFQGRPHEYGWAEELYARLGATARGEPARAGRITHIRNMDEWQFPAAKTR